MKLKRFLVALSIVIISALIITVVPIAIFADTVPFSGVLTAGNTFIRPNFDLTPGSESYSYFAKAIIPDTSDTYEIEVVNAPGIDTTMFLYQDCFDKNNPTMNLVAANDDYAGLYSRIDWPMTAGRKYIVVISTYSPAGTLGNVDCEARHAGAGTVIVSDDTGCYAPAAPEVVWVRPMDMTCKHVWINEDNNFQFVFLYPYKDNNWVKIYAMNPDGTAGEEVFSVDMPHSNPNLIVDLPDGMYIVKTYHSDKPIQEFVIGKPADMSSEGADNTVNHEMASNHETVNSK